MSRTTLCHLILLAATQTVMAQPFPMPETPPNIIVILADDLGYNDLGSYALGDGTNPAPYDPGSYQPLPGPNQARTLTPRIDSIADNGIRFTDYYASAAQCSPARAALMTGCYPYRVGIPNVLVPYYTNPGKANGLHHSELTLAELLKERGYATGMFGKWHLGDTPQYLPTRHGFDTWFGIPYSNDMWPPNSSRGNWPALFLHEDDATVNYTTASGGQIAGSIDGDAEQSFLLEAMTEKTLGFIDAYKDQPFFVYFSPHTVHVPCYPHPDFRGDTVSWYYDQIAEMDYRVGEILDRIESYGLTNNTIVIFTSDNGPWLNRNNASAAYQAVGSGYPLWGRKSTVWEAGPRVPFVAQWPGMIPAGVVTSEVGQHLDLLPTLVQLAGGEVPSDRIIDGGDLWPVLSQQPGAESPSDEFYYFMSSTLYAVRKGDWKYYSNSGSGAGAGSLFNLSTDIQERSNVTTQPVIESDLAGLRSTFWSEINTNKRPAGSYSSQAIVVDSTEHVVPEGATATIHVSLSRNPGGTLTVTADYASGDEDLSISGGGSLAFDSSNWNLPQSLTILALEDPDTLDGTGVIQLSASGLPVRYVYAREVDNDSVPGIEPELIWPKVTYATLPDSSHGLITEGAATINSIPDPAGSTYAWTQVSGDPVVFDNPFAQSTGVQFPAAGDYTLRLTTGYPGATSLAADFTVRVDPNGATPPGGGGVVETERVPFPLDPPGNGSFGSGFTNYRALTNWFERYNAVNNNTTNSTDNISEVLQDQANSTVPTAPEGTHWVNLAARSSNPNPAIYQSLGIWRTGDDPSFSVSFDIGDRSNTAFGSLVVQLVYTDAGYIPNDGTSLTTAAGYTVADSTATYTNASFSGSGNRVLSGLTDTLVATGIADGQEVWVRITASGNDTQSLVDNLSVTSEEAMTVNVAPVVDPGPGYSTAYSVNSLSLSASVSDDGLPDGSVTTMWVQSDGPGTTAFTDSASPGSSVTFDYPGSYTLRLVADDGQIKVFRETTATLEPQTLAEWAVAEGLPSGQQGAGDNFDGDPWTHAFEFAFGLDPKFADSGAPPWTFGVTNAASTQVITFRVPRDRMPDLSLYQSTNLTRWDPSGIPPEISPVDADWNEWSFEWVPPSGWTEWYVRLNVDE